MHVDAFHVWYQEHVFVFDIKSLFYALSCLIFIAYIYCFDFAFTPLLMIDKKGEKDLSLYACFYDYACFYISIKSVCFKNIVWLV